MDLEVSDQGVDGLRQLFGSISTDVSKKVIYNSVKQALTTKPCKPHIRKVICLKVIKIFRFRHSIQTRALRLVSRQNQTSRVLCIGVVLSSDSQRSNN